MVNKLIGALFDLYTLSDPSYGKGTINKVTLYGYFRCSFVDTCGFGFAVRTNSTNYLYETLTTFSSDWQLTSHEMSVNPNTTSAWTWDEITALAIGPSMSSIGSVAQARSTFVYARVNFTPL